MAALKNTHKHCIKKTMKVAHKRNLAVRKFKRQANSRIKVDKQTEGSYSETFPNIPSLLLLPVCTIRRVSYGTKANDVECSSSIMMLV